MPCADLNADDVLRHAWNDAECSACQGLLCSAACAVRPNSAFASVLSDKLAEFEDREECAVAVSGINHLDQAASMKRLLRTALAAVLESQNVKVMNPSLLQVELQVNMLQTPPSLIPVVSRLSIFVRGRYNKLSRCVTQTDWIVDGVQKTKLSVGSIVGGSLVSIFGAKDYNFGAAGREDLDVRMLGGGRPFLVELFNPKRVTLADETAMARAINLVSPEDVQVHSLELLNGAECIRSKALFTEMQAQAEQKRKTYGCVCRASQRVTNVAETLTDLVGEISQKTPIRVSHRRAMLTRVKHVHSLKVHVVDDQYFCMLVEAEAGTYIKELVHGDHGRTVPSVCSLLQTPVDLVQLDVLDLDFDSATSVSSPRETT